MLICSPALCSDWTLVDDNEETIMYMDNDTFHGFDLTDGDRQVSAWVKIVYKKPFSMPPPYDLDAPPFMLYSNRFLVQTRCLGNTYKVASVEYYGNNEKPLINSENHPELKDILTRSKIPMNDFVYINPDLMFSKTAIYLCKTDLANS